MVCTAWIWECTLYSYLYSVWHRQCSIRGWLYLYSETLMPISVVVYLYVIWHGQPSTVHLGSVRGCLNLYMYRCTCCTFAYLPSHVQSWSRRRAARVIWCVAVYGVKECIYFIRVVCCASFLLCAVICIVIHQLIMSNFNKSLNPLPFVQSK